MKEKYEYIATRLDNAQVIRLSAGSDSLSFYSMFGLLAESEKFRNFFDSVFAQAPFEAIFWECPALTVLSADQDAEFVLIDAPVLSESQADWNPFSEHLQCDVGNTSVIDFDNLGGDARLIVPYPLTNETDYSHLRAFVTTAPYRQKHLFWGRVGEIVLREIGEHAIWVSTSGLGVSWLHVRVCCRPKYYQHMPYKAWPGVTQ